MEVKPGYKQTDAGVIPEDWLEHTVGELIDFEGGSQPDKSVFSPSLKPGFVRLIQIRDYKTDKFETYVPRNLVRRFCTENDIMIGRYGPPIFQILRGLAGAYNVALIKAKPRPEISGGYTYYFLMQEKLFGFIEKLSQRSSGQTGVDLKELRAYPLPLPPIKAEQEGIVEALSDADALIESLEQLIGKQRQVKQGLMQELLTGKKRLPRFSGEWKRSSLGSITDPNQRWSFTGGPFGSNLKSSDYTDGGVRIIQLQNIGDGEFKDNYEIYTSRQKADELLSCNIYPGEIILSKMGDPVARACIIPPSQDRYVMCSDGIRLAVDEKRFNTYFVYTQINASEFREKAANAGTGSTRKRVGLTELRNLELRCPPLPEQNAIAGILSDMDGGIAALKAKHDKARQLKQGMVQELLTGRIRLV